MPGRIHPWRISTKARLVHPSYPLSASPAQAPKAQAIHRKETTRPTHQPLTSLLSSLSSLSPQSTAPPLSVQSISSFEPIQLPPGVLQSPRCSHRDPAPPSLPGWTTTTRRRALSNGCFSLLRPLPLPTTSKPNREVVAGKFIKRASQMDVPESRVTEMIERDDRPKWLSYNNHNIKCFTEVEIRRITSNYGDILGKGSFGEVCKGFLEDGSTVAVKRFVRNVEADFAKELKVHSEINHKNVVRLIGYCAEANALMIVTEYISKGNLSDVLHHGCIPIMLDTRLRIAVECSEALCYMHSQMYTKVIHGDIKPANILLDDNLNAKVSDFGISRLVNTDATLFTEHVIGSIGYMDPLFARNGCLTSKSDVYSFGIVLLELITKKKAMGRRGEIGIVECFIKALATGIRSVRELFDVEISSQNNMKVLEGAAKLAGECLRMEMDIRPDMKDVAERLRALRKTQAQGKQTLTIFPWGWRNKPAAENNWQSSGSSLQKSKLTKTEKKFFMHNGGIATGGASIKIFTAGQLKRATNKFSADQIIGHGGHSITYKGFLDDKQPVAVKKYKHTNIAQQDQLANEVIIHSRVIHKNIVRLIGCCLEVDVPVLVYEFVSNGNLEEILHNCKVPLTMDQRIIIAAESAEGLAYMHSKTFTNIQHGDVKPANILLDDNFIPKISDFGISWLIARGNDERSEEVIGDNNYMDPVYRETGLLTNESDVYSFGLVLYELITGNRANCAGDCSFVINHLESYIQLKQDKGTQFFPSLAEVARDCLSADVDLRPEMTDVAERLQNIRKWYTNKSPYP